MHAYLAISYCKSVMEETVGLAALLEQICTGGGATNPRCPPPIYTERLLAERSFRWYVDL